LWYHGEIKDLGTLPGGSRSGAYNINAAGWIAGWSDDADGEAHAVVWRDGVIRDLGPGRAVGINNRGQVVGSAASQAMLWTLK
jgi:probable HAF family extracellular repeat protein